MGARSFLIRNNLWISSKPFKCIIFWVAPKAIPDLGGTPSLWPCRATQCRASVAANSCNLPDVAGMSRYIPHKPQNKTLSHISCHPSVTVSRGNLLAKPDRATRGCSSYTHTNRAAAKHRKTTKMRLKKGNAEHADDRCEKSRRRKRWKTNGEKMVEFWCRFFPVYAEFFTVSKGHKQWKKHLVIDDLFHGWFFTAYPLSKKEREPKKREGWLCQGWFWATWTLKCTFNTL